MWYVVSRVSRYAVAHAHPCVSIIGRDGLSWAMACRDSEICMKIGGKRGILHPLRHRGLHTRILVQDLPAVPKIGYSDGSGFRVRHMRIVSRLLAILTIAALLAPGARWASLGAQAEACACPPAACVCVGHRHTPGHNSICCMGNGGRCGIGSQNSYLSSVLSTLVYMSTEHRWSSPPAPWSFGQIVSDISILPSHARIPKQPPRTTL